MQTIAYAQGKLGPYRHQVGKNLDHSMDREEAYLLGYEAPNHAMPAVVYEMLWHPFEEAGPMHSSIEIVAHRICPHDEHDVWCMVAIFDFNFDRCMDFHYDVGVYVNEREIDEGIAMYNWENR